MNRVRIGWLALFLCAGLAGAKDAPPEKTGLKVGDQAPGFALKDQNGEDRTLASLVKDGPVALVFYRSASW